MATPQGKHVKTSERVSKRGKHAAGKAKGPSVFQSRTEQGAPRHSLENAQAAAFQVETVPPGRASAFRFAIACLLIVMVGLIPLSLGRIVSELDAQAFADPARSAFPVLTDTGAEQPPASFEQYSDIEVSGEDGNEKLVEKIPISLINYTDRVSEELQNPVLSGGCELVSLDIVLDAMGLDADLSAIVDDHLVIDGHFATGYSGDPRFRGGGYPQGIVKAANSYLDARGAWVKAYDLTGSSLDELKGVVEKGYPVLVWTTMDFEDPQYEKAFDGDKEWYSNEHCVVVYGFSADKVLVSDPLKGLVERDGARFNQVYEACGSMSAVVF